MILVVVGAGASYDNGVNTGGMPLVGGLFDNRDYNRDALINFPEARPIVGRLRIELSKSENTAEELLAKISEEAKTNPQKQRQLVALRLYLRQTIFRADNTIISQSGGITAYTALVSKLDEYVKTSKEPVMIVDFNYDCLLEDALASEYSNPFKSFNDYIRGPEIKLLKPHGSIKWFTKVEIKDKPISTPLDLVKNSNWFIPDEGDPYVEENWRNIIPNLDLPLIAVPIKDKRTFACPDFLIDRLASWIPSTSKIINIGWRGAEDHFKDMLLTIEKKPKALIIGHNGEHKPGEGKGTEEVANNLSGLIAGSPVQYGGGFNASMQGNAIEDFLYG